MTPVAGRSATEGLFGGSERKMKDGCTSVAFGRRRRSLAGSHRSGVLAAVFALVMAATLLSPSPANAQEGAEPQAVQVGMFVASIHDLDFYEGTFQAIFWLWFIYDDANYRPLEAVEVVNARDYEIMESYSRDRSDGRYYMAAKFSAEINQHWDTTNFPFDDQRLEIVVESVGGNASELVFRADRDDSVNGGEVVAKGWAIQPLEMETSTFRYNTNFGEETASELAFSRITFAIPLHRDNPKLFFEAYIGYMISFVMCAAIWMTLASNMPTTGSAWCWPRPSRRSATRPCWRPTIRRRRASRWRTRSRSRPSC